MVHPWRPRGGDRTLVRVSASQDRLARCIEQLLDARAPTSSICPSDAARAVDPDGWRDLMDDARAAAGALAAQGRVQVTQRGEVVDVATARGPVRIRRPR